MMKPFCNDWIDREQDEKERENFKQKREYSRKQQRNRINC